MMIKAISIIQPYPFLLAYGYKRNETRSRATKYRGPVAIHASRGKPIQIPQIQIQEEYLSFGAIIAIGDLVDCCQISVVPGEKSFALETKEGSKIIEDRELQLGIYSTGRYVWKIDNIKVLEEPILAKGQLGLWNWDMPASIKYLPKCRVCGCMEYSACVTSIGTCYWVEKDLCSVCASEL